MELEIMNVIKSYMEGEINNCIQVYLLAFLSLSYCYFSAKFIPKGTLRLLALIPVLCLNLLLPLNLHTMHLCGSGAFFIAWLANFKLLMFAFGNGLLSDTSLSLPRFIALACFPIKFQNQEQIIKNENKVYPETFIHTKFDNNSSTNGNINKENHPSSKTSKNGLKSNWNYAIKFLLIAILLRVYDYSDRIHPTLLLCIYSFHIYLGLETLLAIVAFLARSVLGADLEPQFEEPYLSTSLQDFWGRRWNIMVTRILRPTVYEPVVHVSSRVIGRKWATLMGILSTFLVSGLMHELIFYYLGRMKPTWELTCFFVLHGVSLMVEVGIKKAVGGRWRLPRIVAAPLTVGFVMLTSFWLFFPTFLRCRSMEKGFAEYAAMGAFVRDVGTALKWK